MNYAVDSKEMKKIDDYTVEVIKIPALILMERAAMEVALVMKGRIQKTDRILAVCGPGNNGGDGIAAGRILSIQGYQVAILFIGDEKAATAQTKAQLEIARNLGITIDNNKLPEYNIIIDSIFGIGLNRPVTGIQEKIINEINSKDNLVFSIDIPSGISADNGKVMNVAVKANYTITFGHQKRGLLLYPGAMYAGEVIVADIGFPEIATLKAEPDAFYYDAQDLKRLPVRKNNSHKGTFGKVLVIAGSTGMSGAAYLSAKAAYKTGAGLVKVLTAADNRVILQTSLPEALYEAYDRDGRDQGNWESAIAETLQWASVIVIGPGLGQSDMAKDLMDFVVREAKVPVIIDADGLNILSKNLDGLGNEVDSRLDYLSNMRKEPTILTPHLMELSRLMGIPIADITNNMIDTADQCSYNNKLIYAMKDARTLVVHRGSKYINTSGNNGMATGGSGDVLTGIIAAFIAQGLEPYEATCLAVYIHGLAGDYAAKEKGTYSLMAGDIVTSIEKVIGTII